MNIENMERIVKNGGNRKEWRNKVNNQRENKQEINEGIFAETKTGIEEREE